MNEALRLLAIFALNWHHRAHRDDPPHPRFDVRFEDCPGVCAEAYALLKRTGEWDRKADEILEFPEACCPQPHRRVGIAQFESIRTGTFPQAPRPPTPGPLTPPRPPRHRPVS